MIPDSPFSYVATSVANEATFCKDESSSKRFISSVLTSDESLSAQNLNGSNVLARVELAFMVAHEWQYLRGFFSINVSSFRCCKKEAGVSATTCSTRIRV